MQNSDLKDGVRAAYDVQNNDVESHLDLNQAAAMIESRSHSRDMIQSCDSIENNQKDNMQSILHKNGMLPTNQPSLDMLMISSNQKSVERQQLERLAQAMHYSTNVCDQKTLKKSGSFNQSDLDFTNKEKAAKRGAYESSKDNQKVPKIPEKAGQPQETQAPPNSIMSANPDFALRYEHQFNAVFTVNGVEYLYMRRSLFCLGQSNSLRKLLVHIMVNKWFDRFITLCIILNSILLASKEYEQNYDADYVSEWNDVLDKIDVGFSIVFLLECIVKITAMGFITHKKAYIRDPWNVMDFLIVIISVVSFAPGVDQSSLKALRTARILRPLRSLHQLQSMRSLIQTMVASVPGLFSVCLFQTFVFTIFSIISINFFVGKQYQFCRETEELVDDGVNKPYWPIHPDANWQCSSDDMCSGAPNYLGTDTVAKCGDVYVSYGLDPVEYDGARDNEAINFDITNFNSVLGSAVTIFQVITLEGWSPLMYSYQDTVSYTTSSIFFVALVIIGAFTTLNLVLAAIMHSYLEQDQKRRAEELRKNQQTLESIQSQEQGSVLVGGDTINQGAAHVEKEEEKEVAVYIEEHNQDENSLRLVPQSGNPNSNNLAIGKSSAFDVAVFNKKLKPGKQSRASMLPMLTLSENAQKVHGLMVHKRLEDQIQIDRDLNTSPKGDRHDKSVFSDENRQSKEQREFEDEIRSVGEIRSVDEIRSVGEQVDQILNLAAQITETKKPHDEQQRREQALEQTHEKIMLSPSAPLPDIIKNDVESSKIENLPEPEEKVVETLVEVIEKKKSRQQQAEYDAEKRSRENRVFGFFYAVVTSVTFSFLIYCFILANTITLAMFRFDQSQLQEDVLNVLDILFVWVFFVEMIFKLLGLGLKNYIRDNFNIFDGVIVIVSLVDFTLSLTVRIESADGIMSAFRALRLLRVVKLARHWKAFQEILHTMIGSLVDISNFTVLLLLFMYILALLGMELFAYSVCFDIEGEPIFGKDNIQNAFKQGVDISWPRENFNNIFNSIVTVFIVIVAEDWNAVMYLYVRALGYESASGRTLATFYFLCLFILGNVIMLAMFTALLLKSQDKDISQIQKQIEKRATLEATQRLRSMELTDSEVGKRDSKNLCNKFKEACCSRKMCAQRWNQMADSFVKVFGGESALAKRRKLKRQKDPRTSASPSSGNVQPVGEDKADQQKSDLIEDDFFENSATAGVDRQLKENEAKKTHEDFFGPSPEKAQQINQLQRPSSLLHYDYHQVNLVIRRSKTKKKSTVLYGRSLYIFGDQNPVRKLASKVTNYWLFEWLIIFLIVVSTVTLAFEHPLDDPDSEKVKVLEKIDIGMTTVFCLEALLKIISLGFVLNGSKSYLFESWNVLDFLIVSFSVVSLSIDTNLSFVKVLRVARILRPLRLIQHSEGLRVAIQALFKSIPNILRLQVVVLFLMFMISILLTTLLSGKLYRCDLGHTALSTAQQQNLAQTKFDCENYGGLWVTPALNFDDTLRGMLTLFIFQSREGWIGLMWDSTDAVGVDQAPVEGNNPFFIILYMVLVIALCLLFVNMFVRVVIETYNVEKDFMNFNRLLSDEQRSWIQVQIQTYASKPQPAVKSSRDSFIRAWCIKVAQSRPFDNFIMASIMLNTVVMALIWFDEPKALPDVVEILNYVFMAIFTAEAVIKIIALKTLYFKDSWNIFDFTIVAFTLLILLLKVASVPVQFGSGPTVLRALRIGRIIRLIKKAQKLQVIFMTLLDSAASLGSLGLLLIILFFMFAIIGRSMFGMAKIGEPNEELNEHVNFRDFTTSFLLLMRCSTGESWHMIMFDFARSYSLTYQCREEETYETMMANGGEPFACGSPATSYIFFIAFYILVYQIFVNLFVAIIIDTFLGQTDHFKLPVQSYSIQEFVQTWSKYDPDATGYIAISDLEQLILDLARSRDGREIVILHDDYLNKGHAFRRRYLIMLAIPTYCQMSKVMFYDTLQQLCDKKNQLAFHKEQFQENRMKANVLKHFGGNNHFELFQNFSTRIDFEKTVRSMGRLNPRIKLMMDLQKQFRAVHSKFAVFADSEANLHLSDAQRRTMNEKELRQTNLAGSKQHDDINLYTTKHYFFGLAIQRAWAKKLKKRRQDTSALRVDRDENARSNLLVNQLNDQTHSLIADNTVTSFAQHNEKVLNGQAAIGKNRIVPTFNLLDDQAQRQ